MRLHVKAIDVDSKPEHTNYQLLYILNLYVSTFKGGVLYDICLIKLLQDYANGKL